MAPDIRKRPVPEIAAHLRSGVGWGYEFPSVPWVVAVDLQEVHGETQIVGLTLRPKNGVPLSECVVTAERLRHFPLRDVRDIATNMKKLALKRLRPIQTHQHRPGARLPEDHYEKVADFYLRALEAGVSPGPAMAKHWGVSRAAISKWIATSRRLGLLGPPPRPGVAGALAPATKSPRRRQQKRSE